jgi:hypothetical protein
MTSNFPLNTPVPDPIWGNHPTRSPQQFGTMLTGVAITPNDSAVCVTTASSNP